VFSNLCADQPAKGGALIIKEWYIDTALDPVFTRALRCQTMPRFYPESPTQQPWSFLDTRPFSAEEILSLFHRTDELKQNQEKLSCYSPSLSGGKVVFLLFLEPSTRTRLSFEMAAHRLGHRVVVMDAGAGSSRVKGESDVDTVLNVVAMGPDALVIRYNRSPELDDLLPRLPIPVISGGNATAAHPTQALLDAYTIYRSRIERGINSAGDRGSIASSILNGEKVLIVGDINHSRVARSNFDVLTKLGAEIGVCGPPELLPATGEIPNVKVFLDLEAALAWPTVYMGLRVQLERHEPGETGSGSLEAFHERFGMTKARLAKLSAHALILHPGPINHGVEFAVGVTDDPRSRVLVQVSNGVLIRAALLSRIFEDRVR
jgi:aspartate carbamoyltransferase catalytic subunit